MNRARSSLLSRALMHLALGGYTLICLAPVVLVVMNSLKSRAAIFSSPLSFPTPQTFDLVGFNTVLSKGNFIGYFVNSLIITCGSLFFVLLFGAMAAFALSEYRFRGNLSLGLYLSLGIMIPIRLGTIGILNLMVATSLVNTHAGLILVYTAQGLPLAIFILSEFMRQVSDDLKNAARIDGLSEYAIFFKLVVPLIRPAIATVADIHHDPDLERPVVPADPGAGRGDQDRDARRPELHRPICDQLERRAGVADAGDPACARALSRLFAPAHSRHHGGRGEMTRTSAKGPEA